ncbi:MAG: MFS transporter [SAR202 cluster bacterium]|nr:MFS transporter [SAR202 cluster bacterium]|tara:strand:+ start:1890 stop:3260 length:1371 start_codon:yes stop_codon:yes gene_type:complete
MLKPWQIKCQASKVYYQCHLGVDSLICIPAKERVHFIFSILLIIMNTFASFKTSQYRILWIFNLLSYISRWGQVTAYGWIVVELTDSSFYVSLVGFFCMFPMFVLGVLAGYLADVWNRQKILLFTQITCLVGISFILVIVSLELLEFWHCYIAALITGIGYSVEMPSRRSMVHDILKEEGATNGFALDSVAMSLSLSIGPIMAGAIIGISSLYGNHLVFIVLLILHLLACVLMWNLKLETNIKKQNQSSRPINMIDGIKYVSSNQLILSVIGITFVMNLFLFSYSHLIPIIAKQVLYVGPTKMGTLQGMFGVGALTGALLVASIPKIRRHGLIFIVGCFVTFLALFGLGISDSYYFSLITLGLLGIGAAGFSTMQAAIVVLVSDIDYRGKALGVVSLAIGTGPFGAIIIGVSATLFNPSMALIINSVIGLTSLTLLIFVVPSLLKIIPLKSDKVVK